MNFESKCLSSLQSLVGNTVRLRVLLPLWMRQLDSWIDGADSRTHVLGVFINLRSVTCNGALCRILNDAGQRLQRYSQYIESTLVI